MWRAVLIRALWVLTPVVALSAWGWQVVHGALDEAAAHQAEALGMLLSSRVDEDRRALQRQVDLLCRHDQRAQRLAVELRAGMPVQDAARSLQAMAVSFRIERLQLARTDDGTPLSWAPAGPEPARVPRAQTSFEGDRLWLHAHCSLGAGLQLAASRRWTQSELPEGARLLLTHELPRSEATLRPVWPRDQGAAGTQLWLQITARQRPLAAFEAGAALCLVLALGFAVTSSLHESREAERAETTALTAIEQAAARVARGDLVSHIGVRTGTGVDRTLSAFDRMTAELRATREKLVKAERAAAWQDMARRIAHEIKNPLSPIRTAMENLRKAHARRHPDFDEIFEESSQTILEEVERLLHIVREFSDFARLPKPQPGAIDLRDTAAHAVAVAKHGDVAIGLDAPEALPAARADREQLTQVLLNLLQNACAAAAETRGTKARVELRLRRTDSGVRLEVHDNGPGVPPDKRAQIFEPYFTQSPGGSGLGLTIAARIVEEHESTLRVEDSPLGGASFSFELPLDPPA